MSAKLVRIGGLAAFVLGASFSLTPLAAGAAPSPALAPVLTVDEDQCKPGDDNCSPPQHDCGPEECPPPPPCKPGECEEVKPPPAVAPPPEVAPP
ncbi:hypothetical protein ABT308_29510, partial [Saccharopolyspora kobensis]